MADLQVLVVDDQPLMAYALKAYIDAADGMTTVGVAEDGQQALDAVAALAPDVVLMDLQMPVLDGVQATRAISRSQHPVPVVAITTFTSERHLLPVLRAGAVGFLAKDAKPAQVAAAVRAAAEGAVTVTPQAISQLLERIEEDRRPEPESDAGVTARELEVLELLAEGLSNRAIARQLVVSEGTVKAHLGSLMVKLAAENRVDLLVRALRRGLVRL